MSAGQALPDVRPPVRLPQPGWVRGLLCGIALMVLSQVAYGIGLGAGLAVPRPDQIARGAAAAATAGVLAAATIALMLAWTVRRRRHDLRPFGLRAPRNVLAPLGIVLVLYLPVTAVLGIVTDQLGLTGTTTPDFSSRTQAFTIFFVTIAVLIAPWIEEISMRGLVYSSLARRFGFWPAAVVSAFLWSGAHLVPGVLLVLAGEGVLLAYLRSRTGSVLPGVGLHCVQNTIASLVAGVGLVVVPPLLVMAALLAASFAYVRRQERPALPA
jgi:membrane protease YdiL (CAAX protease family)